MPITNTKQIRLIFAVLLVASLLGIALCDWLGKDYKTFALGLLFATANILIFLVK